ncbi:NUDIX domain-containing protein [Rubellimicrobium roseum]|uniref:NUDIX domain-containing protein n=1 Tax=Rubellimicrobium roseum TaxID=687525 RepID=A0A5C4NBM3_9RHOB|nr:NUDIX domain-containing protein [Rubellimicrobium roseum]TNC70976.1 NUDIX domain-containing protein [Rubellimicrobium roseum]
MERVHGAKGALLLGPRLLVTLRDDFDWIPWPGCWDLVGGLSEPGETPRETLVREAREEVGLDLGPAEWLAEWSYPATTAPGKVVRFHVLRLPEDAAHRILFGDEGQAWMLIEPRRFLALPRAVTTLQEQLRLWLDGAGSGG